MADNVTADPGSGGATFATDDISGTHYPRTKLIHGADGTNDGDVSTANPLPVDVREVAGAAISTGGGVESGAVRVTIANDSTGVVSIDDNGGAITVDGTVAVSGTVTVDGSGATQPVSAASLPLPSGASTAAKQPALGTAGTASTDVITVQGIASMTPLTVDLGENNDVTVTGSVTANAGTNLNTSALAVETGGNLAATATAAAAIQTAVETIDNAIAGNEMQVDVVASLPAGTNNIGDVDIASALPAGTNVIGDVGLSPRTSGGLSIFRSIDLDESEEEIKGTAGQVYTIMAFNMTASPLYLKLYNATAASVSVGTTTPVLTLPIPSSGDTGGSGFVIPFPQGVAFSTAITAAVTTGVADNDTGAPGANAAIVQVLYA